MSIRRMQVWGAITGLFAERSRVEADLIAADDSGAPSIESLPEGTATANPQPVASSNTVVDAPNTVSAATLAGDGSPGSGPQPIASTNETGLSDAAAVPSAAQTTAAPTFVAVNYVEPAVVFDDFQFRFALTGVGSAIGDNPVAAIVAGNTDDLGPGAFSLTSTIAGITFDENGANNGGSLSIPPDPSGAVGLNHVVSVVNRSIEWHTKDGVQQNSQSLQSFFGSATGGFDPKVIYDQHSGRYIVVALEQSGRNTGTAADDQSRILVAVSDDSDPNGVWHRTTIDALTSIGGNNTWADYPGIAVDDQAIYITNNMFQFEGTGSYAGGRLWIIDKNGFYAGGAASVNVFDPITASGAVGVTLMPAQVYGNVPGAASTFLVGYSSLSDGTNEFAEVIRIDNPLAGPTFTSQFVNLGNIETTTGLLDAPQLGTATLIETNDSRALNAVWRDGSLYFASTIRGTGGDLNEATAYWAQISTANQAALALTQGGTISGDNVLGSDAATFFPSIAVNGDGDIGVGFSGVSSSTYAGAYFAWRDVNDPLGTLRTPLTVQAGQDYYVRTFGGTRNRWGDYTATVVDPSNDLSFWTFNQYAQTRGTTLNGEDGRWATVWGQFNEAVVAPGPVTLRNAVGTTVNTFATIQAAENAASANFSIEVASTGYAANPEAVTTDLNGLTITIPLGVTPTITLLEAGNAALTIAGAGNATVIGNSVGNALTTGSGNDTLNGAGGTDALAGGAGDDVYIINDGGGDLVTEIVGQGNDEVRTNQAAHLLAANVEVLTYTGASSFTGTGNDAANIITGGALGDTLDGGLGLDTLYGGAGNDVYILNSDADDVIVESAAQGIDDVRTNQSAHFLAANVENVLYTGFGSLFAIGNAENNQITTGAGFDSLYGGAGGDTIYGGASEDVIVGDSGNDSLFGGSGGDVISELFDPLNSGNDTIDGGDNVDIIYSAAGNDSVFGGTDAANNYANLGDGLDSYFGAPGSDVVEGGNGADTINGNAGDDSLFGDDGDDVIFGGSGIDLLAGSTGNDSLDGGDDNDQLVGDGGNDTLRGGDGIDILYGFGDADTLNGGAGGDVDALYGGGGADVFQVGGVDFDYDYIWDFESGSDKIHLETGATITLQYASGTNYFIDLSNGSHVVVVGVIDVLGSDIVLNGF